MGYASMNILFQNHLWLSYYMFGVEIAKITLFIVELYSPFLFFLVFGIFPLKAPYLTWFYMLINIMIGESIKSDLIGILIGHFYYYMTSILPKLPLFKDKYPFATPIFL